MFSRIPFERVNWPTSSFLIGTLALALTAVLIAGVARVVVLQHCTFCINSLCHYLGTRPYSSRCSARDSWLMALVTIGALTERAQSGAEQRWINSRSYSSVTCSQE